MAADTFADEQCIQVSSYPIQNTAAQQSTRFQHIYMYIVDPLPISRGCFIVLTTVDHFTRFPVAVSIQNFAAATVAQSLENN